MSDPVHLPPELLNHIVDLLHRRDTALKHCCLVSKSWIPRARKHLFAEIRFDGAKKLQSWKGTFPDPSTSPGWYTKTLFINCLHEVTPADAREGGWIKAFSQVTRLEVGCHPYEPAITLILSFPLLENLTTFSHDTELSDNGDGFDEPSVTAQPSTSPAFTGSLTLLTGGLKYLAHWLLSLPSGIHFRALDLTCVPKEDMLLASALVRKCSHSLESLDVTCDGVLSTSIRQRRPRDNSFPFPVKSRSTSVDLSRATSLRDVSFRVNTCCVDWIATALQTITPEHLDLRQVSIHVYFDSAHSVGANVRQSIGEHLCGQWLRLDRLLAQLWESHSIRPKIQYYVLFRKDKDVSDCMGRLLPKAMGRRIIDLVNGYNEGRAQGA